MIILPFVLIFIQYVTGSIKIEENTILETCHMEEVDFWKFFYWTFKNCDHLFLETFETSDTLNIIENYLNELSIQISYHKLYKKSFTISKYYLKNTEEQIKDYPEIQCKTSPLEEINATLDEVIEMVSNDLKDNEPHLQKRIRSFSADLNYRYIILINNEKHLNNFLNEDWRKVFPNPRGIFVIVLISTKELSIKTIENLFKKFWNNYGVLNIMIQQPCICNFKDIYTYDPFYPIKDNLWGLVKKFRIDDAILNPSEYRRSLQKLNWFPIKISLFNKMPTAIIDFPYYLKENYIYKDLNLSLGYIGQDGMVLKTLCELLKLTPQKGSNEVDYGYEDNGSFYGNLGEVANRSIEASFNSRYIEGVGLQVIEYLTPVSNDKFCVIVPKALEVPHYLMIFHCFNWHSWLIISLTYIFASIYWFFVRPIKTNKTNLSSSLIISFLEIFCIFVSIPIKLLVISTNHRIFFVACMIFNIIIIGTFQGSLVTSFSTTTHYPDINTLDEFDKSGLLIVTASRGVQTVFGNDDSTFFKKLNSKFKVDPLLTQSFTKIAVNRDMASLDRKADASLKIKMYYTSKENVEMVHIVKDCPRTYHFTYILPKGSPYIHVFNIIITVLREAGLMLKWNSDIVDTFVFEARRKLESSANTFRRFTLEDMKIAFYILLVGYVLSVFVYVLEVISWIKIFRKCWVKK